MAGIPAPRLLATSDLHVDLSANRALLDQLRPQSPKDWTLVAGASHCAGEIEDIFSTTHWPDGVRIEDSLGYSREWRRRADGPRPVDVLAASRGVAAAAS